MRRMVLFSIRKHVHAFAEERGMAVCLPNFMHVHVNEKDRTFGFILGGVVESDRRAVVPE